MEVQAFMGIINCVCRFVPDFALMVKPIHNIIKQDRSFSWIDDVKNAFIRIKKAISSTPVLAKPDFEKYFTIYTNPTEEAVSAILLQCDDKNNEKLVAYMSQSLSDDGFKYSYIEKHVLALVKAVEKFLPLYPRETHIGKSPFACCQVSAFTNLSFKEACTLACQNPGT
jgi:hypothetical protein